MQWCIFIVKEGSIVKIKPLWILFSRLYQKPAYLDLHWFLNKKLCAPNRLKESLFLFIKKSLMSLHWPLVKIQEDFVIRTCDPLKFIMHRPNFIEIEY